jgi:hypothetical protein
VFGQWLWAITRAGDDVYVGGNFFQIGGVPKASFIARWGEPDVVSGTEDITARRNVFNVYPNPTEGIIHYSFDNNVQQMHTVTLTNASGRVIVHKESEEWKLNIGHLSTGAYFLQVQNPDKSGTAKIVLD